MFDMEDRIFLKRSLKSERCLRNIVVMKVILGPGHQVHIVTS